MRQLYVDLLCFSCLRVGAAAGGEYMWRFRSTQSREPAPPRRLEVRHSRHRASLVGLNGAALAAITLLALVAVFFLLPPAVWAAAVIGALLLPLGGSVSSLRRRVLATRPTASFPVAYEGPTNVPGDQIRLGLLELTRVHDNATFEHSSWLAETATKLGAEMGIQGVELERLRWAALLHDLGKIAVSKATLTKAGRLTEAELVEIRRHPTIGADLIAAVLPHDLAVSHAVRHHHERWDGCGYPAGLKGEEIPLASRIVSVVDVFEALISDRPYRAALTQEQAAVYIRDGAGTHFDPVIASMFLGMLARNIRQVRRGQDTGPCGGQANSGNANRPLDHTHQVRA